MPLFGTLQLINDLFLYFHLHASWEISLKIIEQRVWGFEHSLIDGLFIYLLNKLIDDLGGVSIYTYIHTHTHTHIYIYI